MGSEGDGRIRLTLLGGFLGSGKSTWLRHQIHEGAFADALVIVNEAAEVPVDNVLLARSSRMRLLTGGCACCEARAELVSMLREICDERVRPGPLRDPVDTIVLETSGLADPGRILDEIRSDPVLVHHIVVRETVVAVDALHGLKHLGNEPLGRRQAEVADRLVITKVDQADPDAVRRLMATLAVVAPGVPVSGSVMGSEAELPDADGFAPEPLADADANAAPILATKLTLADPVDWVAFTVWLSALLHVRGDDVLRVKGVMRTPAGRLLLQSVRQVVQNPEILPPDDANNGDDNAVVFIGRGFEVRDLRRSLRRFAGVST
jgi:G3E family GTPase